MNTLFFFPRILYKMYCAAVFLVTFLPFYPFFHATLTKRRWHKFTFELKRFHSLILQVLGGIVLTVENSELLPKDENYVVCPNHSSFVDIVLLYRTIPDYFVFMGKKEIERVPLFGNFFKMGMDISVDRRSKTGSHKAFLDAGRAIDNGLNVVIFPEATIPDCAPKMIAFKNGAFKLAIEKQVPIVPVTYTANWKIMQGGNIFKGKAGPGFTKAIIHHPISTRGMTEKDVVELKHRTFNVINNAISVR